MSNLVLGYGLLGKEIVKQTGWDYISREKDNFDFRRFSSYSKLLRGYDTIINCIGYTKTYQDDILEHWDINYVAVTSLVAYCLKTSKKLVHISTDYLYADSKPPSKETDTLFPARNWYSRCKYLADGNIQRELTNYLLVRTSFKPTPFPYEKAIITQKGNFDYVDVIASLIIQLINKNAVGVYNVGTEEKTIYELAIRTKPDVIKSFEVLHETMPKNIVMDLSKMKTFLGDK